MLFTLTFVFSVTATRECAHKLTLETILPIVAQMQYGVSTVVRSQRC